MSDGWLLLRLRTWVEQFEGIRAKNTHPLTSYIFVPLMRLW